MPTPTRVFEKIPGCCLAGKCELTEHRQRAEVLAVLVRRLRGVYLEGGGLGQLLLRREAMERVLRVLGQVEHAADDVDVDSAAQSNGDCVGANVKQTVGLEPGDLRSHEVQNVEYVPGADRD